MSKLSARLTEVALELMADGSSVTSTDFGARVGERYPDLLDAASKYLIESGLWREFKRVMRAAENDEQAELPGLGFPRVIAIPTGDGSALKLAKFATWDELEAAEELRVTNIDRASARLVRFHRAMDRVRPYMEHHPEVRVCDVMAQLGIEDNDGDSPSDGAPAMA